MLTSGLDDSRTSNSTTRLVGGIAVMLAVAAAAFVAASAVPSGVESAVAPTTAPIGDLLLGRFVLPFEVVSVVLLAALLGAVTLARGVKGGDR
jgi:NADH-quinone oxidoreductase subunit J